MSHKLRWTAIAVLLLLIFGGEALADIHFVQILDGNFVDNLPPLVLSGEVQEAKNVIVIIGDGMGASHLALARIALGGPNYRLVTEQMPVVGLVNTHSASSLVTDSAAAATQLATGYWTNDGMVGLLPDRTEVKTILQVAKDLGKSTGLVATSSITNATPASFGAHVPDRDLEEDIAEGLFNTEVDVLIGGGRGFFLPKNENGYRNDNRDLLEEARGKGYAVLSSLEELRTNDSLCVYGLIESGDLPPAGWRSYSLGDLTAEALRRLAQNEKGFFVMIEGSQIDWASHDHDALTVVEEVLDQDSAVKVALDFARDRKDTLVIVTADHETGGLAIVGGSARDITPQVSWRTEDHSGGPVPVYSFGPNSHLLGHHLYLADIPVIIAKGWGVENLGPQREVERRDH